MSFTDDEFFPDYVELLKPDGTTIAIRAQFSTKGKVLTQHVKTPIDEGDELRRNLSNGTQEHYQIMEVHFQDPAAGLPAIYTCHVRKMHPGSSINSTANATPATHRDRESKMSNTQNAVFVIFGRDTDTRDALYSWLRVVGVRVITWDDAAVSVPGARTNFEIVESAIVQATAVIVLFTPDEVTHLRAGLGKESDERYQPRANVIFEAGWALGAHRQKTVIVEAGMTHHISDIDGFNNVRMLDAASLNSLAARIEKVGCVLNRNDPSWIDPSKYAALFPNPQ